MKTKLDIAKNWLPRYTGTEIDDFGDYLLLTNLLHLKNDTRNISYR